MLLWFVIVFFLGVAVGLLVMSSECNPPKAGLAANADVAAVKKAIKNRDFNQMVAHGGDAVDMYQHHR